MNLIIGYSQVFMCIEIISGALLGLNGVWWTISLSSMVKGILLIIAFLMYSKLKVEEV